METYIEAGAVSAAIVPRLGSVIITEWTTYDTLLALVQDELEAGDIWVKENNVTTTFFYTAPGLEIECTWFRSPLYSSIMAKFAGPACEGDPILLIFSDHQMKILNSVGYHRRQKLAIMVNLYNRIQAGLLGEKE